MKQPVLIKLTEGCWGKQRNGEIVGPLEYWMTTGHIRSIGNHPHRSWYSTGRANEIDETEDDIINIISAPEKLPEPFEELFVIKPFGGTQDYTHRNDGTVYRRTTPPIDAVNDEDFASRTKFMAGSVVANIEAALDDEGNGG